MVGCVAVSAGHRDREPTVSRCTVDRESSRSTAVWLSETFPRISELLLHLNSAGGTNLPAVAIGPQVSLPRLCPA